MTLVSAPSNSHVDVLNEDFSDSVGREADVRQIVFAQFGVRDRAPIPVRSSYAPCAVCSLSRMVHEKSKGAITGTLPAVTKIF